MLLPFGCGKKAHPDGDKDKGNPITNAKGPIGQGGDPAAMAVRRAAQQATAIDDLKSIGQLLWLHQIDVPRPTTEGFTKSLEQAKDLPAPSARP